MPATCAELLARHHLGADMFYPRDNILAGTANMCEMRDRFGSPGFLAAYRAGATRCDDYPTSGRPLPEKSRRQVADLTPSIGMRALEFASIGAARAQEKTPQ
jgi:soluble lytic murein transglycosylase-like protein